MSNVRSTPQHTTSSGNPPRVEVRGKEVKSIIKSVTQDSSKPGGFPQPSGNFEAEKQALEDGFAQSAATFVKKHFLSNISSTPGCLFSSSCQSRTAIGADVLGEGPASKAAGHPRDLSRDLRSKVRDGKPSLPPAGPSIKLPPARTETNTKARRRSSLLGNCVGCDNKPRISLDKYEKTGPAFVNLNSAPPEISSGSGGRQPQTGENEKAGNQIARERRRISHSMSEMGPKTVPFGRVGGSSRRGYTIATTKYEKLREECLEAGKLFEDRDFPATDENVFYTPTLKKSFQWKRPTELVKKPKFILDGANRFDIVQGELSDCWLLAAMADLTLNDALLTRVLPIDQGFTKNQLYCGIFVFRFWRHGQWIEVFVDDRLPTIDGELVFMQSRETDEFWSALLEKAYAKVNGSYENLKGGRASEAMEDFTGGLAEFYNLQPAPENLFELAMKSFQLGSMMSCAMEASAGQVEARVSNGLIMGHAYSITDIKSIDVMGTEKSRKVPLIRLRNPWGHTEWNGAFSDGSEDWKSVSEDVRKKLELDVAENGEFWMTFDDLKRNFTKIEMCHLGPETMVSGDPRFVHKHPVSWEASVFSGAWTKGVTAGGCHNYMNTFHLNPQYRISLREVDSADGLASCIVALMQKDRRKLRTRGLGFLAVGFTLYKFSNDKKLPTPFNKKYFWKNKSIAGSGPFVKARQVTTRFRLPPGEYCIVPATFDPDEEGDFLLRVYSEVPITMAEHDHLHPAEVVAVPEDFYSTPPKEEKDITAVFNKTVGKNEEINAHDLASILQQSLQPKFRFDGFSLETIRSMLTMSDVDFSGRIGLEEFLALWGTIKQWKETFAKYDKKNEGSIRLENLREAISAAGYLVNTHVLRVVALRYGQANQTIKFEDFMLCVVRLQRLISIFDGKDELKVRSAIFTFDEWILNTMYT